MLAYRKAKYSYRSVLRIGHVFAYLALTYLAFTYLGGPFYVSERIRAYLAPGGRLEVCVSGRICGLFAY